jgi:hypothetical protein
MAIKKYKNESTTSSKTARKPSVYIAHAKEKTPHGGVVEGKRRSKRTIGKRSKPETQRSMSQKEDFKEMKSERKKRGVRKVEKWETEYRTAKNTYKVGK